MTSTGTFKPRTATSSGQFAPHGDAPLLDVEDLHVEFHTGDGVAKAINGVSFTLQPGRDPRDPRRVRVRQVRHRAGDHGHPRHAAGPDPGGTHPLLRARPARAWPRTRGAEIRGPEISMIFQDALSSLNPVFPVGWQIAEMFRMHRGMNKSDADDAGGAADGAGADPGRPASGSRPTRTSSPAACGSAS